VGIANTAPQYKLHVGAGNDVSDIASTELAIFQNNGSSSISVRDASTNAEAYIYADAGGLSFGLGGKDHAKKVLDHLEGGLTRHS
jgi:hypothetical protein